MAAHRERKLMKRIMIIGCPGSGKSTFSKKLHAKTSIPLYHLDNLYWNADQTTVPKAVFLRRLTEILKEDSFILDGNYASTMELRMASCDTVFFLDYPLDICLDGIKERKGKRRSDMPWIESEEDLEFIEFIKNFSKESRPKILSLLLEYPDKEIFVFKTRAEGDAFLEQL